MKEETFHIPRASPLFYPFFLMSAGKEEKDAEVEKKPASVKRVEQLTGKTVDFVNVDIGDYQALKAVFQKVRTLNSIN